MVVFKKFNNIERHWRRVLHVIGYVQRLYIPFAFFTVALPTGEYGSVTALSISPQIIVGVNVLDGGTVRSVVRFTRLRHLSFTAAVCTSAFSVDIQFYQ